MIKKNDTHFKSDNSKTKMDESSTTQRNKDTWIGMKGNNLVPLLQSSKPM